MCLGSEDNSTAIICLMTFSARKDCVGSICNVLSRQKCKKDRRKKVERDKMHCR